MDHEPLAGVEGDGVRELYSLHPAPELGTHEGRARVRRVHVKPQLLFLADGPHLDRERRYVDMYRYVDILYIIILYYDMYRYV